VPPLGPDEELVAGVRPVEEAFAARRDAIRLLVAPGRRSMLERLVLHATTLRIPIVETEGGTLTAVTGFDGHQGVALVARRRPPASLIDIAARTQVLGDRALVLAIDSLEDPQNLGTLLRSAEAAGVAGVLLPSRRTAPLSPAAIKASAGAVEHLEVAILDDLAGALAELHTRGLRIVGSDAEARLTAREADLRGPLVVVIGSESRGISPAVRRRCDLVVRIPMHGKVGSLNAAVAGSVLLYEVVAQRDEGAPAGSAPLPTEDPAAADATATQEVTARPRKGRGRQAAGDEPEESSPGSGPVDDDLLPGDPRTPPPTDPRA
jgi:23S rRNA (guanosine2251-2'-O)-methyltransferase